jgi:hypothetical protein
VDVDVCDDDSLVGFLLTGFAPPRSILATNNRYDGDKTGTIDFAEMQLLFSDLGESLEGEEVKTLVTKYDKDNSGHLGGLGRLVVAMHSGLVGWLVG